MAKYRTRFNDKARAGGVAKRNALKAKRQKQFERSGIDSETAKEKAERAQQLHEAAKPESEARKRVRMAMHIPEKANTAKKKRLEIYIDRQVRKDEKEKLLKKLARTQKQVHKSGLQSLSGLGLGSHVDGTTPHDFSSAEEEESEAEEVDLGPPPKRSKPAFADLESESSDSIEDEDDVDDESEEDESEAEEDESSATQPTPKPVKSVIIDNRQNGFGFKNLPKKASAKKVSWRERLGVPAAEELLKRTGGDEENSEDDDNEGEDEDDEDEDAESEDQEDEDEEDEEDDGDEDEDEDEDEDDNGSSGKQFVEWAQSVDPDRHVSVPTPRPENYTHKHRALESEDAVTAVDAAREKPGWIERSELDPKVVERSSEVQESRINLPAVANEQQIMDAINHFDVVVVTGATGSGKTTQIPQFLYESGYTQYGMIGVTQPRRVAAVSMVQRIRHELCGACDVGYQIRFDTKVGPKTCIKLMTDGVLLKEMSSDLLLSKYSVIVVDEAHERSINTDILIGLLSRVVRLRRQRSVDNKDSHPLKFIIMSATLRVADFAENEKLFNVTPPVVSVESRQFPVTNHFSRHTATDYVSEAVKKTQRIHAKLPKGGILLFLTGKEDIMRAIQELNPDAPTKQTVRVNPACTTFEEEAVEVQNEEDLEFDNEDDDDEQEAESDVEIDDEDKDETHDQMKMHVLPLYSLLSTEDQLKVFDPVPKGHRLVIVATNVAETSLTIPGIRYVVDCGRAKQRVYDVRSGVQKYAIKWVSQASADQRAGRAGRTGPGHCYRLFSSAMFERDFPLFGEPEIMRMPVEGLVLQMKAMGISNVQNFPFPSPVPQSALDAGIRVLQNLGALDEKGAITPFGEQMSLFPLHPRQAKMLLIGNQHSCLPFVTALVAALSVQDVILSPTSKDQTGPPVLDSNADVLQLLSATAAYSWTPTKELCEQMNLRPKAMAEIASLRSQLARLVATTLKSDAVQAVTKKLSAPLAVPTAVQISVLKQIVAAVYIDQVAIRQAMVDTSAVERTTRQVSRQPYLTVQPGPVVYIFPQTVMTTAPDFLVYSSLTASENSDKVRIRPLTAVTPAQLVALAANTPLLTYSKPLGGAYAPKLLDASKREAWVLPRYGAAVGSGGQGWDLPPKKIVQFRKGGQWINQ